MLRTPLYEAHVQARARLVPFAGWEMPVQYQGVLEECRAVRQGTGLFDVSHMGRVRVRGKDAFAFLQYLTVNDVAKLATQGGQAQYSLFCRDAGGIIDDIIVYRLGASEFIVVVNASNRDKDLSWMRHHATGRDLLLDDETLQTALIAVQGPHALALVDALSDRDLTRLGRFGLDETVVNGVPTLCARTGYTGEDGVEIFCRAEDAPALWQAFVQGGGTPCGLGARDTLRLEAALPLYGHEMDEHASPYEARLGWVVKIDKGDFVGKNALGQLKGVGPRRPLVGLTMETRAIPRQGYGVFATNGDAIGVVTSGTFAPTTGKGIAFARVDRAHAAPGATVEVMIRDTRHAARVVPLPFYKR